ncbi:rubrerythrin-like domain-containing protein [Halorubrum vacuolatum]|uniref:DUF7129 domain-containing protein n=1 Tax=Halorubrum vacuolatum TaxID=63740 RepID=A0A238WXE2_HALVU|nr:rubrerythrin-like domain-containing protein [Halorubrum vacuolatum]SNR51093.1 hypothetical protein SAMN06264855_11110 [Halorubrum vacuolatum]
MTRNLTSIDPYSPSTGYYECRLCSFRLRSDDRVERCPECGGAVRNIAVPRE